MEANKVKKSNRKTQLFDALFPSGLQLTFVVVEDCTSVLIADAHTDEVALSLSDIQQFFIRDDIRVEVDLDGFGVVPDTSVGGVGRFAAAVADPCAKDSVETPELGVRAPESAQGKGGGLILIGCALVYRGGYRLPLGTELVRFRPGEGDQECRENKESRGSLFFHKASNRGRCRKFPVVTRRSRSGVLRYNTLSPGRRLDLPGRACVRGRPRPSRRLPQVSREGVWGDRFRPR